MKEVRIIEIYEVTTDKKRHLDLLLLADEQEDMIDRYLDKGRMFALDDAGVKCTAVVVELNKDDCELKNIAVYPAFQGKGYGQYMAKYLQRQFLQQYRTMFVGTGDAPGILKFYESCGFQPSHRLKNFFTDNYTEPMIEEGVQLIDMVYLRVDRT